MKWVSENQVFRIRARTDRYVRVLWVPPPAKDLVLFNLDDPHALPRMAGYDDFLTMVAAGEIEPCIEEPDCALVRPSSSLSEKERERRDVLMELIRELVEDPERKVLFADHRHGLFRDLEHRSGRGRNYLYGYMRLWWGGGQVPNALAPDYAGRGGSGKTKSVGVAKRGRPVHTAGTVRLPGINITAVLAVKLQHGKRFLLAGQSWRMAYDSTMILHFSERRIIDGQPRFVVLDPGLIPSIHQFIYWVSKVISPGEIERTVRGEAAYARNRSERSGWSREHATSPGAIFQIDATVANIYLRSRNNPAMLVGRPVLYLVTDQYSGLIVGYTVALSPPSWEVAKLAFENAFTDKVESCATLGIVIAAEDWACKHVCSRVTGDRGSEVMGENLGTAALRLGMNVANLPACRPDLKGLVEGKFEWLDNANISWAPGATHGRKRGDKDDRPHHLDGHYDLNTFRAFIIRSIIRHNAVLKVAHPPLQYPMTGGGSPTPNELWNHGCRHLGAPRLIPREEVRANLLHVGTASMRDNGLKFGHLMYVPKSKARHVDFDRIPGRRWPRRTIRHDPRNVSIILMDTSGGGFETFVLAPHDKRFDGWTLEEVQVFYARRVAMDNLAEKHRFEHEVHYRSEVVDLDRMARTDAAAMRDGTDPPPRTKRMRLRADTGSKAHDLRSDQREGAWTGLPAPKAPTVSQVGAASTASHEPMVERSLKPDRILLLRRRQEAEIARHQGENGDGT